MRSSLFPDGNVFGIAAIMDRYDLTGSGAVLLRCSNMTAFDDRRLSGIDPWL
jgi:hypothetical protein